MFRFEERVGNSQNAKTARNFRAVYFSFFMHLILYSFFKKRLYIFKIEKECHDADIILITHDHYDHYSPEDIEKIVTNETIIVAPKTVKALSKMKNVVLVEPNKVYEVKGI